MNDDDYKVVFDEKEYQKWSHFIIYDGDKTVTVNPKLMTEGDVQTAIRKKVIEIPLKLVDVKGYENEYTLEFEFKIEIVSTFAGVVVEIKEEEPVEVPIEVEVVEELINPILIAQIREISTLGKLIVDFAPGYSPPGDLEEKSNFLEISIKPGSIDTPSDKLEFIWEMVEFDESTGEMII